MDKYLYIADTACIGQNVSFGRFCTVGDRVKIGDNCAIGNNVVIHNDSIINNNVSIDDNSIIGKLPSKGINSMLKDADSLDVCIIGGGSVIGACVIIYAGCSIGRDNLIADLSTIREHVNIGDRNIIGRGVAVENCCSIGSNCKLETNVYITAYSDIGDNAFIAPGVVTSNDNYAARSKDRYNHFKGVIVKKGGRIGAQATILPGRIIHEDGFVAAGSTVTKDVEKETIVAGNPAKFFRNVSEDQLLKNQ